MSHETNECPTFGGDPKAAPASTTYSIAYQPQSIGIPRNLPREIFQQIIAESFEDSLETDIEYDKCFAPYLDFGSVILPDASDAERWSRILKLALPNSAEDVDYVYRQVPERLQQRYMGWKKGAYVEHVC